MEERCNECKKVTGGMCNFCLNYTIEINGRAKPRFYINKYEFKEVAKGMWQNTIKERVPVY